MLVKKLWTKARGRWRKRGHWGAGFACHYSSVSNSCVILQSNSHRSCWKEMFSAVFSTLKPCCIALSCKSALYLQLLLAASGCFFIWGFARVPAGCGTWAQSVLSAHPHAATRTGLLAGLSQVIFHQLLVSRLMEFPFPAFLALSSLEQVVPARCCEGLYHGRGKLPNHVFCHSLFTSLLVCVMVQGLM